MAYLYLGVPSSPQLKTDYNFFKDMKKAADPIGDLKSFVVDVLKDKAPSDFAQWDKNGTWWLYQIVYKAWFWDKVDCVFPSNIKITWDPRGWGVLEPNNIVKCETGLAPVGVAEKKAAEKSLNKVNYPYLFTKEGALTHAFNVFAKWRQKIVVPLTWTEKNYYADIVLEELENGRLFPYQYDMRGVQEWAKSEKLSDINEPFDVINAYMDKVILDVNQKPGGPRDIGFDEGAYKKGDVKFMPPSASALSGVAEEIQKQRLQCFTPDKPLNKDGSCPTGYYPSNDLWMKWSKCCYKLPNLKTYEEIESNRLEAIDKRFLGRWKGKFLNLYKDHPSWTDYISCIRVSPFDHFGRTVVDKAYSPPVWRHVSNPCADIWSEIQNDVQPEIDRMMETGDVPSEGEVEEIQTIIENGKKNGGIIGRLTKNKLFLPIVIGGIALLVFKR